MIGIIAQLSRIGLEASSRLLPTASYPLTRFETVAIAGQYYFPIEQGLLVLTQSFEQHRELASREGISRTKDQHFSKSSELCDPFFVRLAIRP